MCMVDVYGSAGVSGDAEKQKQACWGLMPDMPAKLHF